MNNAQLGFMHTQCGRERGINIVFSCMQVLSARVINNLMRTMLKRRCMLMSNIIIIIPWSRGHKTGALQNYGTISSENQQHNIQHTWRSMNSCAHYALSTIGRVPVSACKTNTFARLITGRSCAHMPMLHLCNTQSNPYICYQ